MKSSALTRPVNSPSWEMETNQISLRLEDYIRGVLNKTAILS